MRYGIYIGRFQPFHLGHLSCINQALDRIDKLIIFVGITDCGRTIKDPFTFDERRDFILRSLPFKPMMLPIQDVNDIVKWSEKIKRLIGNMVAGKDKIYFLNYKKDGSTYYLDYFSEYEHVLLKQEINLNATDIRDLYYRDLGYYSGLQLPVFEFMERFKRIEIFNILQSNYLVQGDPDV